MLTMRGLVRLGLAGLLFALWLSTGCDTVGPQSSCVCDDAEQAPVVDATLMAYLSKARVIHHQADIREQEKNPTRAIALLQSLFDSLPPGGTAPMHEAQEVLADTRARLADLRGKQGDFDVAEQDIEDGLRRAPKASYFEGHLHEMRGVNEERRSKALAETGDHQAARQARLKAMKSLEKAIAIQDQVIEKALEPPPQDKSSCPCDRVSTSNNLDDALDAYVRSVREAHQLADKHEQSKHPKEAIQVLEATMAAPPPAAASAVPNVLSVLASTRARIADLHGGVGEFDAAERNIAQGLLQAPKMSYAEGHLHELRGVNEERRAQALVAAGDHAGARRAREAAMTGFRKAIEVQEQVISAAASDPGGAR